MMIGKRQNQRGGMKIDLNSNYGKILSKKEIVNQLQATGSKHQN